MITIDSTQCLAMGAHVELPADMSCGIVEWLSCDDCGRYSMADPHMPCPCGIDPNLDPTE